MNDDWRVRVVLHDEGRVHGVVDELRDGRLAAAARDRLEGAVVISRDGPEFNLYAGSQEDALRAEQVMREVLGNRAAEATFDHARWHAVEERWEPWGDDLPDTPAEVDAEEDRRDRDEEAETVQAGVTLWEVRIELPSRADAEALERRLGAEGLPLVRRHSYVLVGAASEGDADALRERLAGEVPPGSTLRTEGTAAAAELELPGSKLIAVFGGLGG